MIISHRGGALFSAAIVGFIVGIPYTPAGGLPGHCHLGRLARSWDIINCLLVGWDEDGLHIALNIDGTKSIDSLGLSRKRH